jgi:N6-L-threonylcarbamoyladenine synthase
MPTVLAIETSCDETAVAIVNNRKIFSNFVSSQISIHQKYGGVVPEVASRKHLETINQGIDQAMSAADLCWNDIDGIAATCAPGLAGALLVGLTAAKTLAMLYNKPFLGVHHLEGHIYATYLSEPELKPPFLSLLVSGGHTSLIYVKNCGIYEILGETHDDAAGEAFDKVARLLKLGYPGGPIIDKMATLGNPQAFKLPEGRISLPNNGGFHPYDTSFSGLKTAVNRLIQKFEINNLEENNLQENNLQQNNLQQNNPSQTIADIAASFQYTVAKALTKRAISCARDYGLDTIAVGGGVAANSGLRQQLQAAGQEHNIKTLFPPLKFCTDNAAMIAAAASEHLYHGHTSALSIGVNSRLPITEVMKLYQKT